MDNGFNGPELAAEAMRRLAEADRVSPATYAESVFDGVKVDGVLMLDHKAAVYAQHMRETADTYARLAELAHRMHDHTPRVDAWRNALAGKPVTDADSSAE
jgi:hypothetical protein